MIVLFEGIEGSGKSSTIAEVEKILSENSSVVSLKEPSAGPVGQSVRSLVNTSVDGYFPSPVSQLFLFEAARAELYDSAIHNPLMDENRVVLMDRGIYSTLAYQSILGGLDYETVKSLNELATGGTQPDIKILMVVNPFVAQQRAHGNRARVSDVEYLHKAQNAFLDIADKEPGQWYIIDGEIEPQRVIQAVVSIINDNGKLSLDRLKEYVSPRKIRIEMNNRYLTSLGSENHSA